MTEEKDRKELIKQIEQLQARLKQLEKAEIEYKKTEKEISIFHRFAETSGQGFGMATLEGDVIYVNPALCRMFDEEKPEDCYKNNIRNYYSEKSYQRFIDEVHKIVQEEGQWIGESVLRSGKGREFSVIENIFIIRDEKGDPEYYANVITDIVERKRMEKALRENEFRLRQMADTIEDVFWITEWETKNVIYASKAYEKVWGRTRQSLYADTEAWAKAIVPDDREEAFEKFLKLGEGEVYDEQYRITTPDGELRWIRDRGYPIHDDSGKVVRVAGLAQDITEKRKIEEKVKNLAKFPEENPSPVFRINKEGKILYANESAKAVLKKWNKDAGEKAPDMWTKLVVTAIRTNEGMIEEAEVGSRIYSFHIAPVVDSDYANIYAHDITQLKGVEEELKDSRSFLQSIFDGIQDGISVLDKDMNIIKVNLWMENMYGGTTPIIGKKCYQVYQQKKELCSWCPAVKTLETGEVQSSVVPYPSENKPKGWIVLSSYPLKDAKGNVVGIIEHVKDITDKRKAELELEAYRQHLEELVEIRTKELGEANKELEAFSYSVSHDLRAPLRSMDGFSQIILEDYKEKLDDDAKGYLKRIREASQRMAQLIEDILTLSRVTRHEIHKKEIDISGIANEVIKDLKSAEPLRKIDVTVSPKLKVNADGNLMKVVLENLIGNAWKFTQTRPGARIEVGSVDIAGEKAYFVKDTGVGFNMAYADKLFGPFQRLHSEKEFPGTGIGLASVKRIITRHGGRIWADSKVGKGATFYFTLPNK
jgi:PAS domain S-box-containing protein